MPQTLSDSGLLAGRRRAPAEYSVPSRRPVHLSELPFAPAECSAAVNHPESIKSNQSSSIDIYTLEGLQMQGFPVSLAFRSFYDRISAVFLSEMLNVRSFDHSRAGKEALW
jgi:hypothetical protein